MSKQQQKIKSMVSLIQSAKKHDEFKAIHHVAKAIGLHLDFLIKRWEIGLKIRYGIELDLAGTDFWQGFKNYMMIKQTLAFIEPKISLVDLLALYAEEYYQKDSTQDL